MGLPSLTTDGSNSWTNPPLVLGLHCLLTAYAPSDGQAEAVLRNAHHHPSNGGAARKLDEQDALAAALKTVPNALTRQPLTPQAAPQAPAPEVHAPKLAGQTDPHPAP